ncbi:hypothetical protein MXM31_05200 [Klebsiella aerogenes]|nr:hypothetical protein [Klebsiella aerogenes]MEB5695581.1 hypothetical protein [Klebsiella aerogenes]
MENNRHDAALDLWRRVECLCDGKFDVKQKLTSPWNMLIGAQYEITRNFNVLTEFGFNDRNSFFVAGEYRF